MAQLMRAIRSAARPATSSNLQSLPSKIFASSGVRTVVSSSMGRRSEAKELPFKQEEQKYAVNKPGENRYKTAKDVRDEIDKLEAKWKEVHDFGMRLFIGVPAVTAAALIAALVAKDIFK